RVARRADGLARGVGVEVAVAAPARAERHVHVGPEATPPDVGDRGGWQRAVGRYGLTVGQGTRHASSLPGRTVPGAADGPRAGLLGAVGRRPATQRSPDATSLGAISPDAMIQADAREAA